ncbi:MAG: phosphomannomutase/phosphoglucomutase, partial [Rhodospirillales bacterium]|nr:phosphomannomutase/phosphoglucomutase [Rhodospirillales bacterium]
SMLLERDCKSIAVGYDGRLSSPELEEAIVSGLSASGMDVVRIGLGPTPMTYFAAYHLNTDACAMITGSHNPPDYNGIKMVYQGKSFWGPDIQELGRRVGAGELCHGKGVVTSESVFDAYVDRLAVDYQGTKDLKVAWDPGNGASGDVIQALVKKLPGDHILINETIDGTFPSHHPDPTVEANLDQLKEVVLRDGCDLGIGFDGDGDRIGIIDSKARVLWGDQILIVLASEVLRELPGSTIITDVKASRAFFDEIRRMGGKPVMWKTGHSLIKNKMQETGAPLAGEMSAHIFIKHRYYGFDDAQYAAIRVLSILASGDETLADLRDQLPALMNTPELRFPCAEERKLPAVAEVRARLETQMETRTDVTVSTIDGVRVETKDGWWLLRSSNTQDVLVARCESGTQEGLDRLQAELAEQLAASGLSLPDDT